MECAIEKNRMTSAAKVEPLMMFQCADKKLLALSYVGKVTMEKLLRLIYKKSKRLLELNGGTRKAAPSAGLSTG